MQIYIRLFDFAISSINPITGHVEEPMPNPIEEMTEEQKEYEAEKLANMFDKLSRWEFGLIALLKALFKKMYIKP